MDSHKFFFTAHLTTTNMFTNRFSPIRSPHKYLLRKTHVQFISLSLSLYIYINNTHKYRYIFYNWYSIVHLKIISFPKTSLTPVWPSTWCFPQPVAPTGTPQNPPARRGWRASRHDAGRDPHSSRSRGSSTMAYREVVMTKAWLRLVESHSIYDQLSLIICVYIRDYIYYPVIWGL